MSVLPTITPVQQTAQLALLEQRCFRNPYCVEKPTPKQAAFLVHPASERLFGGAVGPGKSSAILMAASMWVDVPNFAALIIRKTLTDLKMSGGLIQRAHQWWDGTDARWNGSDYTWTFPSGARVSFGYLQDSSDKYRYRSSEFQLIAWDELVDMYRDDYLYLFTRLRKNVGNPVPLQMISASNPAPADQPAGQWVGPRFVDPLTRAAGAAYIPARLFDNPYIDHRQYLDNLRHLDPITQAQLVNGDWTVRAPGAVLDRAWFEIVDVMPALNLRAVGRGWDLAATEVILPSDDPDWTAGARLHFYHGGLTIISDVQRFRKRTGDVRSLIKQSAMTDDMASQRYGMRTTVAIAQEPGSSGKSEMTDYARILAGHVFQPQRESGSKLTRAKPLAANAQVGNIKLLRGAWNEDFLAELHSFTGKEERGLHDDQVDAVTLIYNLLALEDTSADAAAWASAWAAPMR